MHLGTGLKFGGIAVVVIVLVVGGGLALAPSKIELRLADAKVPELIDLGRKVYVAGCA